MTREESLETRLRELREQTARLEEMQRVLERDLDELEHHARRVADRRERGERTADLDREAGRLDSAWQANRRDYAGNRRRLEGLRREREALEDRIRRMSGRPD